MSLASYRKRVLSAGTNMAEIMSTDTKASQVAYILDSPARRDVFLNMNESVKVPTIPADVDTYKRRRFLFLPDSCVYIGDYICHDGFTYIAVDMITHKEMPQLIGQLCNFDFPILAGIEETEIDKKPNGEPIVAKKPKFLMKPSAITTKDYSVINNGKLNLPEGSMTAYLPYVEGEAIPAINQIVPRDTGEYKITDILTDGIVLFGDGKKRGYWEVRLQRVVNTYDQ